MHMPMQLCKPRRLRNVSVFAATSGTIAGAERLCFRSGRAMFVESLAQDVRYACRGARRSPLFAVSVAGTIGIGLGVLCAWFTIVNAYLFKAVRLPQPTELHSLSWDSSVHDRYE